jgi:peptidoglycan-associated lipoprotein
MKQFSVFQIAALTCLVALGVAGCKNPRKDVTPIPGKSTKVGPPGAGGPIDKGATLPPDDSAAGQPLATAGLGIFEGMAMHRDILAAQTAYFDFDRSAVRKSEQGKLKAVADHLKKNTADKLLIEGHCDERGTEEYNRALGERRALALREYLVRLGIGADRIRTLSYGQDRPAALGHNEAAWAKNRRGEFIVLRQP